MIDSESCLAPLSKSPSDTLDPPQILNSSAPQSSDRQLLKLWPLRYYYNLKTRVSTWEIPPRAKVKIAQDVLAPMRADESTEMWEEHWDDHQQRPYYFNPKTGETDWEIPQGAKLRRPEPEPLTPMAGDPSSLDPLILSTLSSSRPLQEAETIVSQATDSLESEVASHASPSSAQSTMAQYNKDAQEAAVLAAQGQFAEAEKLFRRAAACAMEEMKTKDIAADSTLGKMILEGASSWIKKSRDLQEKGQRQHVIDELVDTERRYNLNLQILTKAYLNPLDEDLESLDPVISQEEANKLTGNLKEIIKHSDNLLADLENRNKEVGMAMELSMQYVSTYEEYCVRLTDAMDLLQQLKAENLRFKHFLERDFGGGAASVTNESLNSLETAKVQPIDFYLIEPFQRVLRYKLLLERLIKHTPATLKEELRRVEAALEYVTKVANKANEEKKKKEQRLNLRRLQTALEGSEGINKNAKCLKQGAVSRIPRNWWNGKLQLEDPQKRWYYLFDSGLVVSEATNSAAEEAGFFSAFGFKKEAVEWETMRRVRDATDEELGENKFAKRKMFVIEFQHNFEVLEAPTSAEREEWVTELRKTSFRLHISRRMEEGKSIGQIFTSYDKDKDGYLDQRELLMALKSIDEAIDERACSEIMKSFDADGDGRIVLSEFTKAVQTYQTKNARRFGPSTPQSQGKKVPEKPKPPELTGYDKAKRAFCCFTACGCGMLLVVILLICWIIYWILSGFFHLAEEVFDSDLSEIAEL